MKTLFTLVFSCTIMLSAMAQSSMIVNRSSKDHYKNEFRNRFIPETFLQQFDFKTKHKPDLRLTSSSPQKLDSIISVGMDSTTSQWENLDKWEYTYDANNNMTVEISSEWDSTASQWENSWKYEYTYDANGNMSVDIYSDWDSSTSQWVISWKNEYTYDANGNMTVGISVHWNSTTGQWENSYKEEYNYDVNGNMIAAISTYWNSTTNQWENSYKEEYTYDTNGNMIAAISTYWDSTTSQWENWIKWEYTYDTNGNVTVGFSSFWDITTSQWENSTKYESAYDANGNRISSIGSDWDSTTSQWNNSSKYEYTFDLAYLANDLILPYYFYDLWVNKLTGYTSYEYDGTNWVNLEAGTFYYSDVTSVPEVNNNAYTVYPNPASEYVTFDISGSTINSKVDIFTVQGKKIFTQSLNNKTVDVSAFPKGIYFYQLSINGKISSGKIVVE